MKNSNYLVRYVDVVLILLFGFIVISEIDQDSQIVLPSSYEAEMSRPGNEVMLFIGITSDGRYIDEREKYLLENEEIVRDYIRIHQSRFGSSAKVRIRSNFDSKTKHVIALAQICDELKVNKSIDVRIVK